MEGNIDVGSRDICLVVGGRVGSIVDSKIRVIVGFIVEIDVSVFVGVNVF